MSRKRKSSPYLATLKAKPPIYWVKLGTWIVVAGYIAWLSAIHAVANIMWQPNPDLALRLVPDHPLALSRKADELFAAKQDSVTLSKVEAMATQSLRDSALNPVAIRLLGYVADVRGNQVRARELMLQSQKVSRRDFGTQLWLIEDAVARGDKKQALYHYDIAMRTTAASHILLFPTLTGALGDPEVRRGLAPYIRKAPPWLPGFLTQAIGTAENPANVADLLVKSGKLPDDAAYRAQSNNLLVQLAGQSKLAAFRQYYLSLPGSNAVTLRSASFDKATVNITYPQAGWQLADNPAIGGSFSPADKSGGYNLFAFAGSGERGELTRKYLFLKPGLYKFSASYEAQEQGRDSEIRWELQCLSAEGNISKFSVISQLRKGRWATAQEFSLGADCPYQMLAAQLAGGSSQMGAEVTVRSVDIVGRRSSGASSLAKNASGQTP